MSDDLSTKVLRWLRLGGIPLEYEAARQLARGGFDVSQGRSYEATDREGNRTHREIDALAMIGDDDDPVSVALVVECKHTADKPWLVLTNQRRLDAKETLSSTVAVDRARKALRIATDRRWGRTLPGFFAPQERPGFSAVVAADIGGSAPGDRDDRNQARDAMAQVVGAARGVVAASEVTHWRLVWPVVLIDGPLFELDFEEGTERLIAVDTKRLLWYASPYGEPVGIDIVRLGDFERYVSSAMEGLWHTAKRLVEDHRHYYSAHNYSEYGGQIEIDPETWRLDT